MTTIEAKEAASRTINVRVPIGLYQKLEDLAKATARTKSFVTLEALSSYLEAQSWQVKDIQAGLAEADQGDFASEDKVTCIFAKYGS
jgi:RHH-type transcriptional regulator, rel operon repressor / antitoxin RelB